MGLDCTAYRKLKKIGPVAADDYGAHTFTRLDKDFPGRADEIEEGTAYECAETFGWRAGSYSGYNAWREMLGDLVGVEAPRDGREFHAPPVDAPFAPLLNFSDCEGTLGTATCARLAADFAAHQAKAGAHEDDSFRQQYADWRKACEMAADGGAIAFH